MHLHTKFDDVPTTTLSLMMHHYTKFDDAPPH